MTPRTHLLWPVLIALSVGACARQQQPAYYVDSATGQPVAMTQPMTQSMPQPQQNATAQAQQTPERGLYNTFYSQSPTLQYRAPVYAQQQQPAYATQTYAQQPYKPPQQVAQAQPTYSQPQTYAQPQVYAQPQAYRQPAPQYYQPYAGGPYAAAQANPYAQARWY